MRLVIDASVAIEIALAGGRLENLAGHDLVAPTLLRSESTSILAELAWRRAIPRAQARAALDYLLAIPIRQIDPEATTPARGSSPSRWAGRRPTTPSTSHSRFARIRRS